MTSLPEGLGPWLAIKKLKIDILRYFSSEFMSCLESEKTKLVKPFHVTIKHIKHSEKPMNWTKPFQWFSMNKVTKTTKTTKVTKSPAFFGRSAGRQVKVSDWLSNHWTKHLWRGSPCASLWPRSFHTCGAWPATNHRLKSTKQGISPETNSWLPVFAAAKANMLCKNHQSHWKCAALHVLAAAARKVTLIISLFLSLPAETYTATLRQRVENRVLWQFVASTKLIKHVLGNEGREERKV